MNRIALSCVAVALAACQPLPEEPPRIEGFAGCAAPSGDGWAEPYAAQHIDTTGYVTQGGPGAAPGGCTLEDPAMIAGDPAAEDAWWFEVADQVTGEAFTVGFAIPGMAPPFAIGNPIHVLWDWQPPEFGTGEGALELRSVPSDLTLFWAGVASSVEGLAPPGSTLEAAGAVARHEDSCGSVESSEIKAETGGDKGVVGYGERAPVGSNIVHHGGLDEVVGGDGCPDWAPDRAAVAIEYYYTGGGGGGGQQ